METIPRRNRLDLCTPAEVAIFHAMQEVERAGADERLTEAVVLLSKAKDYVSDFVDGVKKEDYDKVHDVRYYHCPHCGSTQITNKESPEWLLQEVNDLKYHWFEENNSGIICRIPYNEITKDEFFELWRKKNEIPVSRVTFLP